MVHLWELGSGAIWLQVTITTKISEAIYNTFLKKEDSPKEDRYGGSTITRDSGSLYLPSVLLLEHSTILNTPFPSHDTPSHHLCVPISSEEKEWKWLCSLLLKTLLGSCIYHFGLHLTVQKLATMTTPSCKEGLEITSLFLIFLCPAKNQKFYILREEGESECWKTISNLCKREDNSAVIPSEGLAWDGKQF